MPVSVPVSVAELKDAVTDMLGLTRAAPEREVIAALNFGYQKGIRAILSVRPDAFLARVPDFQLQMGIREIDVSLLTPPLYRAVLLRARQDGQERGVRFHYRSFVDTEFEERQFAATFSTIFYDVIHGQISEATAEITGGDATNLIVGVASAALFREGQRVLVPGAALQTIGNPASGKVIPADYLGRIADIAGGTLVVHPAMAIVAPVGALVTGIVDRIMVLANPPSFTLQGTFYYQYRPAALKSPEDVLAPLLSDHQDMIVYYALSRLFHATADAQARHYFEEAQELRSELMQDSDPGVNQNTLSVSSELFALD